MRHHLNGYIDKFLVLFSCLLRLKYMTRGSFRHKGAVAVRETFACTCVPRTIQLTSSALGHWGSRHFSAGPHGVGMRKVLSMDVIVTAISC
jgi:hypothetical protein